MDALDMRIVRALGITPFLEGPREGLDALKPSTIARKLGIGLDLAKDRLQRLEKRGVIAEYDLHPNPRLFGLMDVTLHMEVGASGKAQVLDEVMALPGVVGVYDFIGPHLCVQVYYASETDLAREAGAIAAVAGTPRAPTAYFQRRVPEPPRPLSHLDLRILRSLRHRARTPLPEVAAELGVSARTVKRRVARMAAEGQFDTYADIDWSKLGGVLAFDLGLVFPPEATAEVVAAARKELDAHALGEWRPPSAEWPAFMLALWASSPAEVETLRRRAEALPHVTSAWAIVASGGRSSGAWIDRALDDAIARAQRAAV